MKKLRNNIVEKWLLKMTLIFTLFFVLVNCHVNKPFITEMNNYSNYEKSIIERQDTSSMVTFLFFEIYHDSIAGLNYVKLTNKRDVTGKIKSGYDDFHVFAAPYLIVDYYENDKLVHQSKMEHPLFRHVEYFEEDKIGRTMILSQRGEFFVRCQKIPGRSQEIIISEMIENEKTHELTTIKL